MIEGTDLYDYFSCPYKVYNKHHRDRSLMIPFSDFSRRIMELGRQHEKDMISYLDAVEPKYKRGDFESGFIATKKLMEEGVPIIYQGLLMHGEYLGIPDVLIKEEGKSKLGKHHYVAADLKMSMRSKEEQVMQLMFYDLLLKEIQGVSSNKGYLMLKNISEEVDFIKYTDRFEKALVMIDQICKGLDYGLHIDTTCKECPWRDVCTKIAEQKQDVSLIYGLSRPVHYKLESLGIKTLADIETADVGKLSELDGVGEASVHKWKEQANVLITKKEKIKKIEFPKTRNHICLDIESSEDGRVYLIGLWHDDKFVHFFSEDDEKKMVNKFVDYLLSLGDYKLYHYGSIEKTTFRRLFELYGVDENIAKDIISNMIDLLPLVRKNAILPIQFYNLKDVAKYFGFKWRASDAGGGNSMTWYDAWVKDKNPEIYKKILDYNEDDVKATQVVLEKLKK